MKRKEVRSIGVCLLLLLLAVGAVVAEGADETYAVDWWSVGGGESTSVLHGDTYRITGSAGLPATGRSTGGGYVLTSGFWAAFGGAGYVPRLIFLPVLGR